MGDIQCGAGYPMWCWKAQKIQIFNCSNHFSKGFREGGATERESGLKISRGQVFKIKLSNSKSCETGSLINSLVEKQNAGSLQIYTRKINWMVQRVRFHELNLLHMSLDCFVKEF